MSRILLIASDDDLGARILALPGHQVATCSRVRIEHEGLQNAIAFEPDEVPHVAVLGEEFELERRLGLAQEIAESLPGTEIVLVAKPEPELLLRAMRSGVRDVIAPDAEEHELQEIFHRAQDAYTRHWATGEGSADQSRIVVAISPKGGVGKSTVATNLAVGLARNATAGVVLVDLDIQFGDVATLLDLEPQHTLADAVDPTMGHDSIMLKTFLTVHPAGFHVLCASDSPTANERITSSQIRELLRQLAKQFRFVIVDTAAGLGDHSIAALEEATDVVLVSTMDVTCVRAVHKAANLLGELRLLPADRHLVLNLSDRKSGMTIRDVEAVVGLPVDVVVPRSADVSVAGNHGTPLLLKKRGGGPFAKGMRRLVDRVETSAKPVEKIHKRQEIR